MQMYTWAMRAASGAVGAGMLLCLGTLAACGGRQEVSLDDTPPPVHRTILTRLDGGDIVQVERAEEDGRFIYYTEIERGQDNWELIVDEDGEYIGRGDPP